MAALGSDIVLAGAGPSGKATDPANAWLARTDRWGNLNCHKNCIAPPTVPALCPARPVSRRQTETFRIR